MKQLPISASWFLTATQPDVSADAVRIFIFPHGGGNATQYLPWQKQLGPEYHCFCANLPGRGNRWREAPMYNFAELIAALRGAILPLLGKHNVFFGHSLGSLIAFELAHVLPWPEECSLNGLVVSAKNAPHVVAQYPPIHAMSDTDFLSALSEYGGTPTELLANHELMEMMLPMLRADFALSERYECQSRRSLNCPIHTFSACDDAFTSREGIAQWADYTSVTFEQRHFSGGHFYLQEQGGTFMSEFRQSLERLTSYSQ